MIASSNSKVKLKEEKFQNCNDFKILNLFDWQKAKVEKWNIRKENWISSVEA